MQPMKEIALARSRNMPLPAYSARRASTGLTDAARYAGKKLANSAQNVSKAATPTNAVASHGAVSKSSLRINVAAPTEHARPAAEPNAISRAASLRISE